MTSSGLDLDDPSDDVDVAREVFGGIVQRGARADRRRGESTSRRVVKAKDETLAQSESPTTAEKTTTRDKT